MKNLLGLAIAVAANQFMDKTDKSGRPYIEHCLWVMNNVDGDDERKQIAVLHDVPEDTPVTEDDLSALGFSRRVVDALRLLNHKKDVPYDDYIKALAYNKDCVEVKLKDLMHNTQVTRLKGLTKADFDRIEKYHRSFVYLSKI